MVCARVGATAGDISPTSGRLDTLQTDLSTAPGVLGVRLLKARVLHGSELLTQAGLLWRTPACLQLGDGKQRGLCCQPSEHRMWTLGL